MIPWIHQHATSIWWLAGLSILAFVATLVVVPLVVIRLPADYFSDTSRHATIWEHQHPLVRGLLLFAKNALGGGLLIVGLAMLILPGQGLLTLVMGLMLLDFPGKYRVERWLVTRRPVMRSINWLRQRAGRVPLAAPPHHSPGS